VSVTVRGSPLAHAFGGPGRAAAAHLRLDASPTSASMLFHYANATGALPLVSYVIRPSNMQVLTGTFGLLTGSCWNG